MVDEKEKVLGVENIQSGIIPILIIHVTLRKLIHFSETVILKYFPHLLYSVVVRTSEILWYAE